MWALNFHRVLHRLRRSPAATSLIVVIATALFEFALLVAAGPHVAFLQTVNGAVTTVLGGVLVAAFVTWSFVAGPIEAALRVNRRTLRSLFVQNPDAIGIYDLRGKIMRGNMAAAEMMKQPAEALIGAHFTTHMAAECVGGARAMFQRAAEGGTVAYETTFVGAAGERIEVSTTLFPHVLDDEIAGVFGVARDIGELKRSQAAYEEQTQRIAELHRLAATPGRVWRQQIEDAMAVACRRLRYDEAIFIEIVDETENILARVGNPADGKPNDRAVCRFAETVIERADLLVHEQREAQPSSLVGAPVPLPKGDCAALVLASTCGQLRELTGADRDFLRVVTDFVASTLERGRQQERLDQLAFFDALTGLPNRVLVSDRLAELLGSAQWRGIPFAVHYIDLDRFKAVNDHYGHAVGDAILRLASRRMQDAIADGDMVARLGGDEFVVVQPLTGGSSLAKDLALRILAAIAQPFCVDGVYHELGVSIGISISPNNGRDSQTLLQRADEALYRAKREGRNRLEFAYDLEAVAS